MSDEEVLEFPAAPLSPSLPADFLEPDSLPRHSPTKLTTAKLSQRASPAKSPRVPSAKNSPLKASPVKSSVYLGAEDERSVHDLKAGMAQWIEKARAKKHESDRANTDRMHVRSMLLAIDSLVCFMVAFNLEDRADAIKIGSPELGKPVHARSWSTLIPFLSKVAAKAETVDADLAGICYYVSAVVNVHLSYMDRHSLEAYAHDTQHALADFKRALRLLPNDVLRTRYKMDHTTGWNQVKVNAERPDPVNNRAVLPLHVNSTLAEAAAFALNVATKWARLENMQYTWVAAD